MKLIIDTDPGIDDALAILYGAAHPGIDLLGLTTVFGNVTVEQATRNALHLVERIELDIPVAGGASKPLLLPPFPPNYEVHGLEGFGTLPAVRPARRVLDETAAQFLVRMAREHAGELMLCPIGPITNVAEAIALDPGFVANLQGIVVMGGALDVPGNVTPHAEANTYHDPHALDIVLNSGARVLMLGLDVTMQVLLNAGDFAELARIDPLNGPFLQEMSHFYLEYYHQRGLEGCGLHDPLAVMACVIPDLVSTVETPLEVVLEGAEIGRIRRSMGRPAVSVAVSCDPARVKRLFMETFREARAA